MTGEEGISFARTWYDKVCEQLLWQQNCVHRIHGEREIWLKTRQSEFQGQGGRKIFFDIFLQILIDIA